jgi:hypothetical protein
VAKRPLDATAIEQRLLDLAYTTDAKITATALAFYAPCSIDDASRVLEDLAARDRLRMDIEDDGTVAYHLLGRQKLAAVPRRPLVRAVSPRLVSPMLAALLTVLVPGAGHLYARHVVAAIAWFAAVSLGYALILPGLVLHLVSIVSAAAAAHRLNEARAPLLLPAPQ